MFLSKIHLDPRCREVRRDLSDPYQLHSTLCRAFSSPNERCPAGEFLWRTELETNSAGFPRILVQSRSAPDWSAINLKGWLAEATPAIDLRKRLNLDSLRSSQRFRFRLRANPCVTRNGKRVGCLRLEEQVKWIEQKAELHGFSLPPGSPARPPGERLGVRVSHPAMLSGKQHSGNAIRVFSVLYDGVLTVSMPEQFKLALQTGIGHGKVMGLGLLSVVPEGSSDPVRN